MKMQQSFKAAAAAVILAAVTHAALAQRIALTLDDGPMIDATPLMSPAQRNGAMLDHLRSRGVQAMFFVTVNRGADTPEGLRLLQQLSDGGQLVGNHTVTHPDFNAARTSLDQFESEVDACDAVIRPLAGYRRFMRFPYLREGAEDAKRDGIRTFLQQRGYRIGYVSIDTSDWLIDEKLRAALRKNPKLDLAPWRALYLDHLWRHAQAYDKLAHTIYGREVPQVILLHHRLLNALFLGDVIDFFRAKGWRIVSPDEAFADPAYAVAPMLPKLDGSVLETTAQALGVPMTDLRGMGSERQVGQAADALLQATPAATD